MNAYNKMIPFDTTMGEIPMPSRDYYTFAGWFTSAEGGTQVTADTTMTALIVLQ